MNFKERLGWASRSLEENWRLPASRSTTGGEEKKGLLRSSGALETRPKQNSMARVP